MITVVKHHQQLKKKMQTGTDASAKGTVSSFGER